MYFSDRADAGRHLGRELDRKMGRELGRASGSEPGSGHGAQVLVLGLARGGLPVAFEVAAALEAPLEVFLVRKLGVPGFEELAMGAIASGGVRVLNESVLRAFPQAAAALEEVSREEGAELARREALYREGRPPPAIFGRTVILVDDGLATGATMRAAVEALRRSGAKKVIAAVPVGSARTCRVLAPEVDALVCLDAPEEFGAVGAFYEDFSQVTDDEVQDLLARAAHPQPV